MGRIMRPDRLGDSVEWNLELGGARTVGAGAAGRREEEISPDTWYDYTLYLQPAYYTVAAGHRLELYVVPFCGFSDDAAIYDSFSPAELEAMSLPPEELVPVTRDYRFTVDQKSSFAVIPVIRN